MKNKLAMCGNFCCLFFFYQLFTIGLVYTVRCW